jgi:hypothetical protein
MGCDRSQFGGDLSNLGLDSLVTHFGADLALSHPLLSLGVLENESGSSLDLLADGLVLALNLGSGGALSDGGVASLVDALKRFSLEGLLPDGELLLEGGGVLALQLVVVLLDVDAHDVLEMLLGREVSLGLLLLLDGNTLLAATTSLGFLPTEAGESLLVMGDVESTIASTLHGTEHSVTSGSSDETDIEVSLEWASLGVLVADVVELAVSSGLTNELGVDLFVGEQSTGEEETSGVGGGVVGETAGDVAVVLELLGVSGGDSHVTLEGRVDDGGEDTLIGETDDHSVLLGVVLILVVDDKSLTSVVVGLSLSSTSEFGLISLRVGLVFKELDECHVCFCI